MKNRETRQFTGYIWQIFTHLVDTYGKISPSQLRNFEKNLQRCITTQLHRSGKFQKYWRLTRIWKSCTMYSQPQVIEKSYNSLNWNGKFRKSIKSWNNLPAIKKHGLISRYIFVKHTSNSPKPANWIFQNQDTEKPTLSTTLSAVSTPN